ncbi:MAG TPA: hypothetical protein ENJ12_05625 [Thiolapillus brandeum]|uniref:C-type lysozyme inhibitor domain-containing protein n=1 Tax=Thiolapillus brandeum TaxID=1076588 RepID=A0A831RUI9_9GAMM|nr:hypothetical protein [Thiolapillus brandeum]
MTYRTCLPLLTAMGLTACSLFAGTGPENTVTLSYQCNGNIPLTVDLTQTQARVVLKDKIFVLPRRSDMKGERYVSDDHQTLFLRKGDNAVLAVSAGHGVLRCRQSESTPKP